MKEHHLNNNKQKRKYNFGGVSAVFIDYIERKF